MRALAIAIGLSLLAVPSLPDTAEAARYVKCKPGYFFHHSKRRCIRRVVRHRRVRRQPVRRRYVPPRKRYNKRVVRRKVYRKPVRRVVHRKRVYRKPPPRRTARPRYITRPARTWHAHKFTTPTTHVLTRRGRQRTQYCGMKGYYMGRSNGRAVCYKGCPVRYSMRKYGPRGQRAIYCVASCQSQGGRLQFFNGREKCVACPPGYSFNNPRRRCEKRVR